MDTGEDRHPQGIRVDLDPLPDVEDRTAASENVVDDPEVDEGVLGDPTAGPRANDNDDGGGGDERNPGQVQALLGRRRWHGQVLARTEDDRP
jgi:hypothetical protein